MFKRFVVCLVLPLLVMSLNAKAQTPEFTLIDQGDLENVVKDFSSIFTHSSVSPASSLGILFGVEVGVIGGMVQTPNVDRLAREASPGASADEFPHVALLAAISVPLGFTIETNFIPTVDTGDVSFSNTSFAVKWTMTDTLVDFGPFDLAVKGIYTKSSLGFSQLISLVTADVDVETTVTGLQLIGSMNLGVVEPYIGIGTLSTEGTINVTAAGGATIFDPSLTLGQAASASPTSTQYFAGIQANLLFFRLGFEYGHLFDSDRVDMKFSFKF